MALKLFLDPIATTCRPVTFMALHAGIELELEEVSLFAGEQDAASFRAISPQGLVPILQDGEFILSESQAILRYLASRFASSLYPADVRARARVDEMLSWSATTLNVALGVLTVYPRALGMPRGLSKATVKELSAAAEPRLLTTLDQLEQWLGVRRFAAGDSVSIADFHLLSTLTLADLIGFSYAPWPAVGGWLGMMQALPGWRESYAGFEGLVSALRAPSGIVAST